MKHYTVIRQDKQMWERSAPEYFVGDSEIGEGGAVEQLPQLFYHSNVQGM